MTARDAGDTASEWLSTFLSQKVRLVGIDSNFIRFIDGESWHETGFADGFPLLVLSQASLVDLNHRLKVPIEMIRFRPNLVVGGCHSYDEDNWSRIRIGDVVLASSGPCSRCTMTTIDPNTGTRDGNEPLATLAKYRKIEKGIVFGQNFTNETKSGRIETGMNIEIL